MKPFQRPWGLGNRARHEKGTVLPIVGIIVFVLIGFAGLAIDLGQLHEGRRQLQNSVDAAALAGARYLPAAPGSAAEAMAIQVAGNYVDFNGFSETPAISTSCTFTCGEGLNDTITVAESHVQNNFLMGVLGTPQSTVGANAKGIAGSLVSSECLLPLAALAGDPSYPGGEWLPFNSTLTLKQDAGNAWSGNFQGMDFNYQNTSEFFDALAGACNSEATVGESYDTQTGAWGNTFLTRLEQRVSSDPFGTPWQPLSAYVQQDPPSNGVYNITTDSPRFVYVPVVRYSDMVQANGKKPLEMIGIAKLFLTFLGCDTKKNGPVPFWEPDGQNCVPGEGMLQGRLIQAYSTGTFGRFDEYGTLVQRLWQ